MKDKAIKLIYAFLHEKMGDLELNAQHIFNFLPDIYKILVENDVIAIKEYPYARFEQIVMRIFQQKREENLFQGLMS